MKGIYVPAFSEFKHEIAFNNFKCVSFKANKSRAFLSSIRNLKSSLHKILDILTCWRALEKVGQGTE